VLSLLHHIPLQILSVAEFDSIRVHNCNRDLRANVSRKVDSRMKPWSHRSSTNDALLQAVEQIKLRRTCDWPQHKEVIDKVAEKQTQSNYNRPPRDTGISNPAPACENDEQSSDIPVVNLQTECQHADCGCSVASRFKMQAKS